MFVHPRKPFAHTLNEGSLTMSPEHFEMSNDFCPQAGRASLPDRYFAGLSGLI